LIDGHTPPIETMFEDVYKDMPPHLQDQLRQAREFAPSPANNPAAGH
jgi:2-oxoisovalerate dehydrogenase E1 component alpha subunit